MNIVGVVVSFLPPKQEKVSQAICGLGGEVHAADQAKGKMVVTLEHLDNRIIADTLIAFQNIDGVLNAAMVYHEVDEEQQ